MRGQGLAKAFFSQSRSHAVAWSTGLSSWPTVHFLVVGVGSGVGVVVVVGVVVGFVGVVIVVVVVVAVIVGFDVDAAPVAEDVAPISSVSDDSASDEVEILPTV